MASGTDDKRPKRVRVSKACDACRRKKVKCDGASPICQNCAQLGVDCTYLDATKKRGPPRGYIDAIENRLHRMESLLGGLIQSNDPRAHSLLKDLVNEESKGPKRTRAERLAAWRNSPLSREPPLESIDTSDDDKDRISRNTFPRSVSNDLPSMDIMNELSDIMGQLSVDENREIHYYGKTSGLYLLQNSHRFKDGVFKFPRPGIWPRSDRVNIITEQDLLRKAGLDPDNWMPCQELSDHLLDLYFTYVHPFVPIIYKPTFKRPIVTKKSHMPALLLNAMFSFAARFSSRKEVRTLPDKPWTAGDPFFDNAKALLNLDYDSGKITTVQALILLSMREQGCGRGEQAFLFSGMAIRMAQSLGLHRDCDKWQLPADKLSHEEKETRKRVFWVCFMVDKFMAANMGRPMALFEKDFDTSLPNTDEPDEFEPWNPYIDLDDENEYMQSVSESQRTDSKSHAISNFNHIVLLCEIMGRIMHSVYALKLRVLSINSDTILSVLDSALTSWFLSLPVHLKYSPNSDKVPAPHVLLMHAYYYTSLIVLHRPFITLPNQMSLASAYPSHSICTSAANAICDILDTYEQIYGLRRVLSSLVYPILTSAIMHVFNASSANNHDIIRSSKLNLSKCLHYLSDIKVTWVSALHTADILAGLVDLREVSALSPEDKSRESSIATVLTSDATAGSLADATGAVPTENSNAALPSSSSSVGAAVTISVPVTPSPPESQPQPRPQPQPFAVFSAAANYIDMSFLPTAQAAYPSHPPHPPQHNAYTTNAPAYGFSFDISSVQQQQQQQQQNHNQQHIVPEHVDTFAPPQAIDYHSSFWGMPLGNDLGEWGAYLQQQMPPK